jgi:hypothetical protein
MLRALAKAHDALTHWSFVAASGLGLTDSTLNWPKSARRNRMPHAPSARSARRFFRASSRPGSKKMSGRKGSST